MNMIQYQIKIILFIFFVALGQLSFGQNTKVFAFVKDSVTWQPVDEAVVHVTENNGLGGVDTTVMTGKKGFFQLLLAKNKEYLFNVKQPGYTDESMVVSTVGQDSLRFSIYLNPIIIYNYMCPFVHFDFNQFENRSDSAFQEMKWFKLDTAYGFRCCIMAFADADEEIEIAYKRAMFVYDELVKMGMNSEFIRIQTQKTPLFIDSHFELKSKAVFKMKDVLTSEYIQKLAPEFQKLAHLYNRRVMITHCL